MIIWNISTDPIPDAIPDGVIWFWIWLPEGVYLEHLQMQQMIQIVSRCESTDVLFLPTSGRPRRSTRHHDAMQNAAKMQQWKKRCRFQRQRFHSKLYKVHTTDFPRDERAGMPIAITSAAAGRRKRPIPD